MNRSVVLLTITVLACFAHRAQAADVRVATAANFRAAMTALAVRYEQASGQRITVISGSTGKHYAQIVNGAPFHAYFAADVERPRLLEERGFAVRGSRFTYALGSLVLWSSDEKMIGSGAETLKNVPFRHLAIANPELAPYGRAARETLQSLGLWAAVRDRLVLGENANQAFQFVHSGNAELGLVALTQVHGLERTGLFWPVPQNLHQPIEQQAVLLVDEAPARAFMQWMRGAAASKIILGYGYGQP